jgi:hypothetical protein
VDAGLPGARRPCDRLCREVRGGAIALLSVAGKVDLLGAVTDRLLLSVATLDAASGVSTGHAGMDCACVPFAARSEGADKPTPNAAAIAAHAAMCAGCGFEA